MSKASRVAALLESSPHAGSRDPRYEAFFHLFNAGGYYEAHDVLEHLWLREKGEDRDFYKALIQLAGAFVHLRLNHEFPSHATHSRRLAPARRLFLLAEKHLAPYPDSHHGLNVGSVRKLASRFATEIERENSNPWIPGTPVIHLEEIPPRAESTAPQS